MDEEVRRGVMAGRKQDQREHREFLGEGREAWEREIKGGIRAMTRAVCAREGKPGAEAGMGVTGGNRQSPLKEPLGSYPTIGLEASSPWAKD